jgi:two-component system, chemotaxis family, sensor kinase CheA
MDSTEMDSLPVRTSGAVDIKEKSKDNIPKESEGSTDTESIRVKVSLLNRLMSLAGEMVLVRNQQMQLVSDHTDAAMRTNTQKLDLVTSELQECVMQTRMQPVGIVFNKLNRIVRDLGKKLDKEIQLNIEGGDVEMDKNILEALTDPLTHMIRNSCDHGLETPATRDKIGKNRMGSIYLSAWHEGGQVHIGVKDDGNGINLEAVKKKALEKGLKTEAELAVMAAKDIANLVLLPGFSTVEAVSDLSGRGVGMDVVRSNIEKVGGTLELDTIEGQGSSVRLQLPLTLAIIPCLIVKSGEFNYAIPQINLEELVTLYNEEVTEKIELARGREVFRLREQLLPIVRLNEVLESYEPLTLEKTAEISSKYRDIQEKEVEAFKKRKANSKWGEGKFRQSLTFAVLKSGFTKYGLIIDEVIGTEEIVVKSMHTYLNDLHCYAGATVMGDGRVSLILDVLGIAKHSQSFSESTEEQQVDLKRENSTDATQGVLVFRYGKNETFAIPLNVVSRIEKIDMKQIEFVGGKEFISIDNTSTQVLKLDELLNVSELDQQKKDAFLLLPKNIDKPYGVLISGIEDSIDCELNLNTESHMEEGLMGTSIINEKMTLFIDIYKLIDKADPGWSNIQSIDENSNQQIKILFAEDVLFFRNLVKGYLESAGYTVTAVENGKAALEAFQKQDFDIIVSDIEMPVMNGNDFMRNVRTILNNTTIPSIALTALTDDKDIKAIGESGFDVYELKMDRERLLSRVKELLP